MYQSHRVNGPQAISPALTGCGTPPWQHSHNPRIYVPSERARSQDKSAQYLRHRSQTMRCTSPPRAGEMSERIHPCIARQNKTDTLPPTRHCSLFTTRGVHQENYPVNTGWKLFATLMK